MNKYLKSVYTDGSIYFVSNPLPKKGEAIVAWHDLSPDVIKTFLSPDGKLIITSHNYF